MKNDTLELKLSPIQIEDVGQVNSGRLVSHGGRAAGLALLTSAQGAHAVLFAPLDGLAPGQPNPLFKPQSPFGTPSWDIGTTRAGAALVWAKPGSAICPLVLSIVNAPDRILTNHYPMGVFQNPRFVRGNSDGVAVTAVTHDGKGSILALYTDAFVSAHAAYATLPSAGPGTIVDGLLLRQGTGYLLFVKILATGQRGPERKDLRGESVQQGILHCLRLNGQLQPVGTSLHLIGDAAIFEFDADVSGEVVFLLATNEKGYRAAKIVVSESKLDVAVSPDVLSKPELLSPSVLATGGKALATVIQQNALQRRTILIGEF